MIDQEIIQRINTKGQSIYGVGCDIVTIARIAALFNRHHDKFAQRILSPVELEVWHAKKNKGLPLEKLCAYLAKRWAGKEAVVKAAGTGFVKGISWREISILNNDNGVPQVSLHNTTAVNLGKNKQLHYLISLSDEKEHALAFCIAVYSVD